MPAGLYEQVKEQAEEQGVSTETLVVSHLTEKATAAIESLELALLSTVKSQVLARKTVDSMKTDRITIQVDVEAAQAYRAASEEERRKIDSLLNLKLRSVTRSQISLKTYMDEISRRAKERGLTTDILESLLNDEEE